MDLSKLKKKKPSELRGNRLWYRFIGETMQTAQDLRDMGFYKTARAFETAVKEVGYEHERMLEKEKKNLKKKAKAK